MNFLLSSATIENWQVQSFGSLAPLLKFSNSHLAATNLTVHSFENINVEHSTLTMKDSVVKNGTSTQALGGLALHSQYSHMAISNSSFSELEAAEGVGAAIKFEIEQTKSYKLTIDSCTFALCRARQGGAI